MSTSKSSFISRSRLGLSRLLGKPTVHVCGLLGTYNIEGGPSQDDDFWMATDFIALRQLLGARDDLSEWFCGKPIRTQRGFLLGDPACDRMVFNPSPFEIVLDVEPQPLAMSFLVAVSKASSRLSNGDTLVIVLVGHGDDQSHAFVVGDDNQHFELKKETLEQVVRGTKGNILVISTACFSGSWKSEHWTLLAAAGPDQLSVSIVVSSSGECRGGSFTDALLAEHADEFNVRPPYPAGPIDNSGRCRQQRSHNFGPEKTTSPSPRQPKRSMWQDILNWIYRFRNDIGRTYPSADITLHPCQLGSHHLPFASLISGRAPFHKLTCVAPSPSADQASIRSVNTLISPLRNLPSPRTLSEEEEATLINLATDHLHFMPPSVASELPTILQCHQMIHGVKRGRDPLSDAKRSKLYSTLTNMAYQRDLALMIAKSLGWERAVAELGGSGGLQRQVADVIALRREAEASGCLVSILTFPVNPYTRWAGAAGWLARVWEASGRLIVPPNDWTLAVEQALLSDRKCC